MRYLAVDLGDRRTGLAVGDDETGVVTAHAVIEAPRTPPGRLHAAIEKAIDDLGPGAIVVGLPLNMDGTEGARSKTVRAFADELGARVSLPIHLADERLSSAEADWTMAQTGLTRDQKKSRRDALAAAVILRTFFESRHRAD